MLEFMHDHLPFARGQISDSAMVSKLWTNLTLELNEAGGAMKDRKQWQRCWSDWKSTVKSKAAQLKAKQQRTGGAGPSNDSTLSGLSEMECRILSIIGPDYCGDEKTPEFPSVSMNFPSVPVITPVIPSGSKALIVVPTVIPSDSETPPSPPPMSGSPVPPEETAIVLIYACKVCQQ
ncbi:myb-related transcription factor, partner of profilin-like [Zophobas morio]|uniref:myb-related transcription factor, partner of profilin-like n=1 Tax=Zophobas morio TaxID=2755281 RepID=UPI0030837125